jgi:regulator of sigma E protease
LILAAAEPSWLSTVAEGTWLVILVLIGVNMLIIVHELGHFLVARMCGVKCEKFYIWFDIFGWKLFKFKRGETEYGLGVLPLGGYVKMLGQEDNPARLKEELERAKARQNAADEPSNEAQQGAADDDGPAAEAIDIEAAEAALYDPRSYLAQSVPKRMAIISAGVIMNVAFAFVAAMIAYQIGVFEADCVIGRVDAGGAAWHANLKMGDRIEQIAGKPVSYFTELQEAMVVGDIEGGVPMVIQRPGLKGDERLTVTLVPDRDHMVPTIGISSPVTRTIRAVLVGSPAAKARRKTEDGATTEIKFTDDDAIVRVGGQPIASHADFCLQETLHRESPLEMAIDRLKEPDRKEASSRRGAEERVIIDHVVVAPRPMLRLGLKMKIGRVLDVQPGSPAAAAGIGAGDRIEVVNGEPVDDAVFLAERLRRISKAEGNVELSIRRADGSLSPVSVQLRKDLPYEVPLFKNSPLSSPELGIAYAVENEIAGVVEGSAADGKVKPGEKILAVTFIPPDKDLRKRLGLEKAPKQRKRTLEVGSEAGSTTWASVFYAMQDALPGTQIELGLADRDVPLGPPAASGDWFNPDRGFDFRAQETFVRAATIGEAVGLGWEKTADSLMMVFRFLGKIGSQVSAKAMGGPVTIVEMAYSAASSGMSELLMFLCIISANLAVINILPIPVLDGGHMVFLAYEGIRGKPPSERIHVGLSYLGLFFILGLMVWVLGLDFGLIPRH